MKTSRVRLVAAFAGVAVAFALLGVAVAPRSRSQTVPGGSPGSCDDFVRGVDPAKVPVDTVYDPERDVVFADFMGRTYVLRPDDPACRALPEAGALIDDALAAHRENMSVACAAVRGLVADDRAEHRGRRVNQKAARTFISRRCS